MHLFAALCIEKFSTGFVWKSVEIFVKKVTSASEADIIHQKILIQAPKAVDNSVDSVEKPAYKQVNMHC